MKKMLTLIVMSFSFVIADSQIWVCDYNGTDTFTVCMDLHEPINGAQFGIDIPGFSTTSIGLGSATLGWQQYGSTDVLGFWFGAGNGCDANPGVPQ